MILEWLFTLVLILSTLDLIIFPIIAFMLYKKIMPIIEKENNKPYQLDLMEQWLNDAYREHPDSKPGLLQVRKKLRNQKGGR